MILSIDLSIRCLLLYMLLCGLQTFKSYISDFIGDEDEEEKKEEENVSIGQLRVADYWLS